MAFVFPRAGVHQDGVVRRAYHEGLVRDEHHPRRGVEHLRLHHGQMPLEGGLVVGRKEILRPPPRPLAFDHRIDGDVADADLSALLLPPRVERHSVTSTRGREQARTGWAQHRYGHRSAPPCITGSATRPTSSWQPTPRLAIFSKMTESAKQLRSLSLVLSAQAKALRKAAEAARERGAVWREMARIAREAAGASREQAVAARKRQEKRCYRRTEFGGHNRNRPILPFVAPAHVRSTLSDRIENTAWSCFVVSFKGSSRNLSPVQ